MRNLIGLVLACIIALGGGSLLTVEALKKADAFGRQQVGAWSFWPLAGSVNADPYTRALVAQQGRLSMGVGEGIALFARQDESGAVLSGQCTYEISGDVPAARFMSITIYDASGDLQKNALSRSGFTGDELVRQEGGQWTIRISAAPSAGNWLPVAAGEAFIVVLRLYDTPLSAAASGLDGAGVPKIIREGCQ